MWWRPARRCRPRGGRRNWRHPPPPPRGPSAASVAPRLGTAQPILSRDTTAALVRPAADHTLRTGHVDLEREATTVHRRQPPHDLELLTLEHGCLVADAHVGADRRLPVVEVLLRRLQAGHLDELDHPRGRQDDPRQVRRRHVGRHGVACAALDPDRQAVLHRASLACLGRPRRGETSGDQLGLGLRARSNRWPPVAAIGGRVSQRGARPARPGAGNGRARRTPPRRSDRPGWRGRSRRRGAGGRGARDAGRAAERTPARSARPRRGAHHREPGDRARAVDRTVGGTGAPLQGHEQLPLRGPVVTVEQQPGEPQVGDVVPRLPPRGHPGKEGVVGHRPALRSGRAGGWVRGGARLYSRRRWSWCWSATESPSG